MRRLATTKGWASAMTSVKSTIVRSYQVYVSTTPVPDAYDILIEAVSSRQETLGGVSINGVPADHVHQEIGKGMLKLEQNHGVTDADAVIMAGGIVDWSGQL